MAQVAGTAPAHVEGAAGYRKITAGMIGGAVAALTVFAAQTYATELTIPPGVESAIGTLVTAVLVFLVPEHRG